MRNRKIAARAYALGAGVAFALFAASGLWAQTAPSPILESPQSTATEGRFRSSADNFIRTDTYGDVKFDKFFAYTSFYAGNKGTLGFGTKLGSAYIGLYYGGNFWSRNTNLSYTEADVPFNGGTKSFEIYDEANFLTLRSESTASPYAGPDNRVAILIGAANMGFRISYGWTHEFFDGDNIAVMDLDSDGSPATSAFYKKYHKDFGMISPQLEWAMAKDLTEKNGIRPKIGLTLNFGRNYETYTEYNPADGSTSGEYVASSGNYVGPHLVLNPGGYHVYNQNGFRLTVDLDYELQLRFYNDNEYSRPGTDGKYKTEKIDGIGGTDLTEKNAYVNNLLTPSLAGQWSGGPFAFKFKLNVPLRFTYEEDVQNDLDATDNYKLKQDGNDFKRDTFDFEPNLRLAAQWKAVPDKLALNIGARLTLGNIKVVTEEGDVYVMGVKGPDYKTVRTTYAETVNNLRLGVTFTPTGNLTFEAACGMGTNANNNYMSVFTATPNGMFYFSNILVSLRY